MQDVESALSTIQRYTKVYRDTYANLPITNVRDESLGYATDRLTLYRWSGIAWEEMTIYASSGATGAIPTAADLPEGSLYFDTTTNLLYQVQSATWVQITLAGSGWILLDSVALSNDASVSLTFAAHDLLKVELLIKWHATTSGFLRMTLNNITSGDYHYRKLDLATISTTAAAAHIVVAEAIKDQYLVGEILLSGRQSDDTVPIRVMVAPSNTSDLICINGECDNIPADVTRIDFLASAGSLLAGDIHVYGKNL